MTKDPLSAMTWKEIESATESMALYDLTQEQLRRAWIAVGERARRAPFNAYYAVHAICPEIERETKTLSDVIAISLRDRVLMRAERRIDVERALTALRASVAQ